jgi:hypothetical protein
MNSAAEKASTSGHHDHGLNSPISGSPSSMSAVSESSGSSPPWARHAVDVEADHRGHEHREQAA